MKILYGTGNKAKFNAMRGYLKSLEGLGLEIISPDNLGTELLEVPENGKNPLENARAKAKAYYEKVGMPVFSCDSGLYAEGIPDSLQPGVHIRRVGGKRLTDSEMMEYYGGLAANNGGKLVCRYNNAICLVTDRSSAGVFAEGARVFEHMGEDISSEPFIICDKPHAKRVEGFPLDALSVHINSGMYYYELYEQRKAEPNWHIEEGFCAFIKRSLALE